MSISCLPTANSTLSAETVMTFPLDSTRYRNYHPTLGRWIERDPAEDGLNEYGYGGSAPGTHMDPSGLRWIRIPGVLQEDAEIKQQAIDAINSYAPAGYAHVSRFGLDKMAQALTSVLDSPWLNLKRPGLVTGATQTSGMYLDTWNTLILPEGASRSTILHEVAHVYDDKHGIHLTLWANRNAAEDFAQTAMYLADAAANFKEIEDWIKKSPDNEDPGHCGLLKNAWNGAWRQVANILSGKKILALNWFSAMGIGKGRQRRIKEKYIKEVGDLLGLKISCKAIVDDYNSMMNQLKIPSDSGDGSCCRFECPHDLPAIFR